MPTHLILGGARSGKSAFAEQLASASGLPVTYIATAQVYDAEFGSRVEHHKIRRPTHWKTIEQSFNLADVLQAHAKANTYVIVDCLTLWLAQCICPDCNRPETLDWQQERNQLLAILPKLEGNVLLVSNEVGMGIVPLGEINRQFQDEQGRLNQAVAERANKVSFIAAGLPLTLKG
ncbi:MAG: bifunctional adenosylcobinamide kinase/adenosylcobinamide-phosphate guanylyltransferase [Methylotenera sp.]|uniref:bifunctional adenosylcobinamide kinase/adenosylcobinamide-phosphate guanylyltransferase n=1 Tax=Methylotenera sp. TaxID=2051956 RepID=UPI002719C679|nr:bifunctional adenosylcobinamide kinase/adenosylcobinamide-phosphate guanylyltransferase [Methylotenera sp.]MDO9151213.1 bifunctional adenosylcobinamide kinase/adenosylcobinamide-phosphate guanylyltransferase [Methylotenera sp.]